MFSLNVYGTENLPFKKKLTTTLAYSCPEQSLKCKQLKIWLLLTNLILQTQCKTLCIEHHLCMQVAWISAAGKAKTVWLAFCQPGLVCWVLEQWDIASAFQGLRIRHGFLLKSPIHRFRKFSSQYVTYTYNILGTKIFTLLKNSLGCWQLHCLSWT